MKISKEFKRYLARALAGGAIIIIVIFSFAAIVDMMAEFCGDFRWPLCIALAFAIVSGLVWHKMWRPLTNNSSFFPNYVANFFVVFILSLLGLLYANEAFPPKESNECLAPVERIYKEVHYKARRVSRKVYVRDVPYNVYMATLHLPDGNNKNIKLSVKEYNTLRKGDSIPVNIITGALGWQILKKL